MKKQSKKKESDAEMRAHYDFSDGVRGKHYQALQAGYTITIHHADGTTEIKDVRPQAGVIRLEPDVLAYFSDSESVNATLRSLIRLIPNTQLLTQK